MVTRSDLRVAGVAPLLTGALLAVSLVLFRGGPPSAHPNGVLAWHAANAGALKLSSVAWLLAMLALVGFAVGFREGMWATVLDRSWMTVLFVQGAGIFATVAVVSAAVGWALADQAAAGTLSAEMAGMVWSVELALLRFAAWGLTAPLIVVGAALARHSTLGQVCAVAAVLVAGALLVPLTWGVGLYAFAAWLGLAGVTLLVPRPTRVNQPAPVAHHHRRGAELRARRHRRRPALAGPGREGAGPRSAGRRADHHPGGRRDPERARRLGGHRERRRPTSSRRTCWRRPAARPGRPSTVTTRCARPTSTRSRCGPA